MIRFTTNLYASPPDGTCVYHLPETVTWHPICCMAIALLFFVLVWIFGQIVEQVKLIYLIRFFIHFPKLQNFRRRSRKMGRFIFEKWQLFVIGVGHVTVLRLLFDWKGKNESAERTRSSSMTANWSGCPRRRSEVTTVPIGEFSSTRPSSDSASIRGLCWSTAWTTMLSAAVAKRFASVNSSARMTRSKWPTSERRTGRIWRTSPLFGWISK